MLLALPLLSVAIQGSSHLDKVPSFADAPFVFEGVVKQPGLSNVPAILPGSSSVTVSVTKVLSENGTLGQIKGSIVTLQLSDGAQLLPGQDRIFFVTGLSFGETIGFKELGIMTPDQLAKNALASAGDLVSGLLQVRRIRDLGPKSSYFIGRVHSVSKAKFASHTSEHNPKWIAATIDVFGADLLGAYAKGIPKHPVVYFRNSSDRQWKSCPRFHAGQIGLWIVQPIGGANDSTGLPSGGYATLASRDYIDGLTGSWQFLKLYFKRVFGS